MKKKHIQRLKTMAKICTILSLGYIDTQLYELCELQHSLLKNPYHDVTVDMDTLSFNEQEKFILKYLKDMKKYPLFIEASKLDKEMITKLANVCIHNPYIHYNNMADAIAVTRINYYPDENKNILGETFNYDSIFGGNFKLRQISLYNLDKEEQDEVKTTYFHELIHAIFPKISESLFFEEGLTELITKECYETSNIAYPLHHALTKMWVETLGVDSFLEIRATGSLDPLKKSLYDLGYDEQKVASILKNLDDLHWLYKTCEYNSYVSQLKEKFSDVLASDGTIKDYKLETYLRTSAYQALQDIQEVYQCKHEYNSNANFMMAAYETEITSYFDPDTIKKCTFKKYFIHQKSKLESEEAKVLVK